MITREWTKSSRSSSTGSCVEVRRVENDNIQVRDSKDPSGPLLTFAVAEWEAFINATKDNEFSI